MASILRVAIIWTPDGRRKRGRPYETWRRTVERDVKEQGWTREFFEGVPADRPRGSFRLLAAHDISKILYANKCQDLTIFHAFTWCRALAAGVRKLRGRHGNQRMRVTTAL